MEHDLKYHWSIELDGGSCLEWSHDIYDDELFRKSLNVAMSFVKARILEGKKIKVCFEIRGG